MCFVIVVLSQKQRRHLYDRVSHLISMSLSIKLQHSWLCLYQKLPGMPTIFVIYLAQHSSVCGFATHEFDIFISRFFNCGILFNVSAFAIHVHMGKSVASAPTHICRRQGWSGVWNHLLDTRYPLWCIMLLDLHIFHVSKAGPFLEGISEIHYPLGKSDMYHISIICSFLGFYWIISATWKAPGYSSLVFTQTSIPQKIQVFWDFLPCHLVNSDW